MGNIIRINKALIQNPRVKWEPDKFNGGARQIVTVSFEIPDLPMTFQSELAAQVAVNGLADVVIELEGPTFYMPSVNRETGEIEEDGLVS
jgi:hypothetical protein